MISIEDEEKKQAEEEQREAEAQAQQEDKEARMEDEGLNENSMDIGDDKAEEDDNKKSKKEKVEDDYDKVKKGKDTYDKLKKEKEKADQLKKGKETAENLKKMQEAQKAAEAATKAVAQGAETAAVESAAAGTAAGGAAAAGAGAVAAGTAAAPVLLIVLLVILIIIIVIGVAGFFTTMPQFLWNRLKEMALSLWDGVQGYVIGMDESTVNKDDIIYTAQYLYDMGYDLVGMGFAESVEIYGQKDEDGNEIPVEDGHSKNEIKKVDAPYLRAYLVAENRTYLVNNYTFNLKDFANSFFDGSLFDEGMDTWGTGMIDLDSNLLERIAMPLTGLRLGEYNLGELIKGVKVERETNSMQIRKWNFSKIDYTHFSLEGWTGRYGKPFELLLTLHVATMAPDLVKEIALNDDLDTKVHIKLRDTDFSGIVLVDGKTIDELEAAGTYSEDTIEALRNYEKKKASDINTSIPYISSVTKHWFRNVYFEGTDSDSADKNTLIGVDDDGDGLEDYNETSGPKTQKTKKLSSSDNTYNFGDETNDEIPFPEDLKEEFGEAAAAELGGADITIQGSMEDGVVQTKDAVRGVTNPTTKELFSKKYYIYDGTVATAKKIQEARAKKDNSIKEKISFTKDSLQAFTILEESETLDAQYIYRDLKELVIELGYFEKEDFYEIEKQVLEWPIAEYVPGEWPDSEIEKQVYEYGTLIACDETVAYSLGMSVKDLRKMTATEDEIEENEDDNEQIEDEG